jgi:hypothetical protein
VRVCVCLSVSVCLEFVSVCMFVCLSVCLCVCVCVCVCVNVCASLSPACCRSCNMLLTLVLWVYSLNLCVISGVLGGPEEHHSGNRRVHRVAERY